MAAFKRGGQTAVTALLLLAGALGAQPEVVPSDGVAERPSRLVAITDARIVVAPGRVIERGAMLIRDGRIEAIGANPEIPLGAHRHSVEGLTVLPAFIDLHSDVGVPETMRAGAIKPRTEPGSPPHDQQADQPGTPHWNRRVRPELSVADQLDYDPDAAAKLRKIGFAAVQAAPEAGIFAGSSALLTLGGAGPGRELLLHADTAQHIGFDFAYGQEYPGSLMGAIALIRQTFIDARWNAGRDPRDRVANAALAAVAAASTGRQRVFFRLDDELDVLRVSRLQDEFDLDAVLVGSGYEYRVLDRVRQAGLPMVLPLNFPEAPEIEKPGTAVGLSLAELQHWEQAALNPSRVAATGIPIALTIRGLNAADKDFWPALRRAIAVGLDADAALAALSLVPAQLLGVEADLGSLQPGRLASFIIAEADLFESEAARIHETWVAGERFEHAAPDKVDLSGKWRLQWSDAAGPATLAISGRGDTREVAVGDTAFKLKSHDSAWVALPDGDEFGLTGQELRLMLELHDDALRGFVELADGSRRAFTAERQASAVAADAADAAATDAEVANAVEPRYPAGEYGRAALPLQPRELLIQGATVWTNTDAGVMNGVDVLVRRGRIAAIGTDLAAAGDATVIDGRGRHLTAGIIDAHSHTAIARNVNEPSHAVTTEVRVADVIDPTDINIYRQLAGGVTTANLLHGSANPMGGQNAVIKLRWGADAEGLLLEGAPAGVKFALGENVKQANWGDGYNRYPQSRMGVEQIMRDHFNAAIGYRNALRDGRNAPRRDLRLEALVEILEGRRLIHIHSYRQDEILMFARLAQEFGFGVASFQHVLEGYKVADVMAELGAGASTFSDWWAFKMEVQDAIPYNGALMTRAGVLTSFNSDSSELARRLNTEAAKAVKYGALGEQEAWKLVTLNPAIQLGIDDRVGAIRPGLDADLVLWSDHPLSSFARAEQTFIDGRSYFDLDSDAQSYAELLQERERLLQAIAQARRKQLSMEPDGDDDGGSSETAPAADARTLRLIQGDVHWLQHFGAHRGLYHSGADLTSCGANDHVH